MIGFFQLFWTYLKIGTFTLGGGYAMIPLIQREVVDRQHWIDEEEFLNMIALAQAAPGIIAVNSAIFIGWRCGGWRGTAGAVLGAMLAPRRFFFFCWGGGRGGGGGEGCGGAGVVKKKKKTQRYGVVRYWTPQT